MTPKAKLEDLIATYRRQYDLSRVEAIRTIRKDLLDLLLPNTEQQKGGHHHANRS